MAAAPTLVWAPYLYLVIEIGDFLERRRRRDSQQSPRALPGERLSHSMLAERVPDRSSYPTHPFVVIQTLDGKQLHKNLAARFVGQELRRDLIDAADFLRRSIDDRVLCRDEVVRVGEDDPGSPNALPEGPPLSRLAQGRDERQACLVVRNGRSACRFQPPAQIALAELLLRTGAQFP